MLALLEEAGGITHTGKKKTPIDDRAVLNLAFGTKKLPQTSVRIGSFFQENAVSIGICCEDTALRVLWHAYNAHDDFSYLTRCRLYTQRDNTLPERTLKIFVAHFLTGPMTAITSVWPIEKKQAYASILVADIMNSNTHKPTTETERALKHILSLPINARVNWKRKP